LSAADGAINEIDIAAVVLQIAACHVNKAARTVRDEAEMVFAARNKMITVGKMIRDNKARPVPMRRNVTSDPAASGGVDDDDKLIARRPPPRRDVGEAGDWDNAGNARRVDAGTENTIFVVAPSIPPSVRGIEEGEFPGRKKEIEGD
jgi:hypothetical protein